ncbi:MAG TPA: hypothetical protein VMW38_28030 [Terriglobia bacterium]|nr:hypothetical protein [Terriglobia bacterium]
MERMLDHKLAKIHADPVSAKDFILADAKDADMAFGIGAPGQSPEYYGQEGKFRSLAEYRELIRQVIRQGLVDIVLMSASSNEILTIEERLFDNSPVTPAARANDTTDIHVGRGVRYWREASRPFRTATIDQMQCGKAACEPEERWMGADLGLYSVTFNNDIQRDLQTIQAYREFRIEAEKKGFRHFLEVFDPNTPSAVEPELLGHFINDHIVRLLAGVPRVGRPIFLKIVYHGPKFMEELVSYDPHLVTGILGGASGTTYDAFKLLAESKKYGARAALYGRKINNAEHQLAFIEFLRLIADGLIEPEDAVSAYHDVLRKLGIRPHRSLEKDLELTNPAVSYSASNGRSATVSIPSPVRSSAPGDPAILPPGQLSPENYPLTPEGKPDFARFTQNQRLRFNEVERDRIFGSTLTKKGAGEGSR